MNIGSVEQHGGSAPFAPHADGELFVDRSQGWEREKQNDVGDVTVSGSSNPLKMGQLSKAGTSKKSLGDAMATDKSSVKRAKGITVKAEKKTRRKKKWRKPRDKPNRPLSAYNLFFARERALMLGDDAPTPEQEALKKRVHCKTHGKIGFAVMARTIGAKWKSLEPEQKKVFEDMAKKEKDRYQIELGAWKEAQRNIAFNEKDMSSATGSNTVSIPMSAHAAMFAGRMASGHPMQQLQVMQNVNKQQSDSMRFLLESGMNRRNLSQFQAPPQSEYIRNIQELPIDQALMGMSQRQMMLDVSSQGQGLRQQQHQGLQQDQQYPSAAEASANTLLNHFQKGFPGASTQNPFQQQSQQQNLMDQKLFQEFAAMRRMQQRFMAGGYGMNGMPMSSLNSMNISMSSSGMNPFNTNNALNMGGNGVMPGMNNNMNMRGGPGTPGGMNMNNFGNGL
ncbi:HMG high mobility group box-containing protein [Nitzschia inconspicua]|uniref:HMG high mobility group box-containing protein n=1 Tax=Nitzschia inconspicua TaxID=303405 RepID=A0A9K3LMB4_9STRA|nr:HMG high mobility group box-containing protein [Nitzschia inconspicua]